MNEPLPIDWSDVCGDAEPEPPRHDRDLDGQGLDPEKRATITDIPLKGSYL